LGKSGHIQIFQAIGHGITFPKEIEDLLFRSPDVKKLTMFKADIDSFSLANRVDPIEVTEVHPVIKKNIPEIDAAP
jgi:hypothetical protein